MYLCKYLKMCIPWWDCCVIIACMYPMKMIYGVNKADCYNSRNNSSKMLMTFVTIMLTNYDEVNDYDIW